MVQEHPFPLPEPGCRRREAAPRARAATLWALLFLTACCAARSQQISGYIDQKQRLARLRVDTMVNDWLQLNGVPGAVVTVVEGHQLVVLGGYGVADVRRCTSVDPAETIFSVGELVRPMTAIALLQLAESGALDLSADISGYFQSPAIETRLSQPLTAVHLLTHSAGFDERIFATRARSSDEILPLAVYLRDRMPPRIRPAGHVSVPSPHGYALAGLLVEELSGRSFADYVEQHVFAPLSMTASRVREDPSLSARVATGHRRVSGRNVVVSPDYPQTAPASSLWTTATDVSRWLLAILNDGSIEGRRLLQPESTRKLITRQFTNHRLLPGRSLAFREGNRYLPPELFQAARGHGFSAVVVLIPDRRLGLFAAFNCDVDFWGLVYQILDLFWQPAATLPAPSTASGPEDGSRFAGFWRPAAVSHTTMEKLATLVWQERIRAAGPGALLWRSRTYRAIGPLAFQEVAGQRRLCFIGDGGQPRFAATRELVLERLRWHESWPVQAVLWLAFAAAFLAGGWVAVPLPRGQTVLEARESFSPRWPITLARLAATLHFLFIVILSVLLASVTVRGAGPLLYGAARPLILLLSLPLVAAALTLLAATGFLMSRASTAWRRRHRLHLALLLATLLAFLPFLYGWNLLGFAL